MNPIDLPALWQSADSASLAGQKSYAGLVRADLLLVVLASVLAAAGGLLPPSLEIYFAVATALVLLGGLIIKVVSNTRRGDRDWFDGRAVADTVMAETWRYMMRVDPYEDEVAGDESFLNSIRAVLGARPDLHHELSRVSGTGEQITERMRAVRSLPVDQRLTEYVKNRLDDQAGWYRSRALSNRRAATRYFWASLGAQTIAFAIAVLRPILVPGSLNLVGPFAVLATALAAWSEFRDHEDLSKSYAVAYQELLGIRSLVRTVSSQDHLARLVQSVENAIAHEHTSWIAKRTDPLPGTPRTS
jgi:hypothetical protein